ncbi:MAG: hypothetical protein HC933_15275 [Pleurocapsa sp. SU_196_0]|nr:hypothetical protein [Pleurocapsa sp. SU_196_0]
MTPFVRGETHDRIISTASSTGMLSFRERLNANTSPCLATNSTKGYAGNARSTQGDTKNSVTPNPISPTMPKTERVNFHTHDQLGASRADCRNWLATVWVPDRGCKPYAP